MLFSKDGDIYRDFSKDVMGNPISFAKAVDYAARSLSVESGGKIYYKENQGAKPLPLVYRV